MEIVFEKKDNLINVKVLVDTPTNPRVSRYFYARD